MTKNVILISIFVLPACVGLVALCGFSPYLAFAPALGFWFLRFGVNITVSKLPVLWPQLASLAWTLFAFLGDATGVCSSVPGVLLASAGLYAVSLPAIYVALFPRMRTARPSELMDSGGTQKSD